MATDARRHAETRTRRPAGSRVHGRPSDGGQVGLLLLEAVDTGLAAALFVVPFILGGRLALGHLVLVTLAVWVAVCWCLRQCLVAQAAWIRSSAEPLLLAALALVGLQLVSLPPSLLSVLSPRLYEILPLWAPDAESSAMLGVWTTPSLTPAATGEGLILLTAFVLLFLVTVQRVRQVEDVERLLRWIAVSTLAMAVFALVQYVTSNGKFYWFFEHPFTDTKTSFKGSFTNRNHFAQFIALGVGPLAWWVWHGLRSSRREPGAGRPQFAEHLGRRDVTVGLRAVALGFCIFMALISLSRGGAMAVSVAVVVCTLFLYRGSQVGRKLLLAVIGIGLFVGACLATHGYQSVAKRLDDFGSLQQLDQARGRRGLWQADAEAVADYPLLGTGLGSHREVFPMYLHDHNTSRGIEYTHAENGYVQVALETGVPGLLLVLIAVGLCGYWCCLSLRRGVSTRVLSCFAAIAASLAASFTHSMTDFVWYVPGCMLVPVVLAACACRLGQINPGNASDSASRFRIPRIGWLAAAACTMALGLLIVPEQLTAVRAEPFWHRYLLMRRTLANLDDADRYNTLQSMQRELSAVVQWQPDHARAQTWLAAVHLELFNRPQDSDLNPLDVKQVRDAVLASSFESSAALNQWLSLAFGERRRHLDAALKHVRRAVRLCPLQGEAYLHLADLSFLEGPHSPGKTAYVGQALKVRPFDGTVLFTAGQEAMLAGNPEQGRACWRASFQSGAVHQNRLIELLAGRVSVRDFLDLFQPDLGALARMIEHYGQLDRPDELQVLLKCYATGAENQARLLEKEAATPYWLNAADAYRKMDNLPEALRCLRQAVRSHPSHYVAHCTLGSCLLKLRAYEEAEKHLTWCLQRKPQDKNLRALVESAVNGRLRSASRPATSGS